jgi:hypothetical protein
VLEEPTVANEFEIIVTGYEDYVNPCLLVGTNVLTVVNRDYSVSFASTDANSPDELKWIDATKPIDIELDDKTVVEECPLFYTLSVKEMSTGKYKNRDVY